MSEVVAMKENRKASDLYEDLDTKLSDINAVIGIMTACDKDECDVNGAAFAIERMIEDAKRLADELYRAPYGGAS